MRHLTLIFLTLTLAGCNLMNKLTPQTEKPQAPSAQVLLPLAPADDWTPTLGTIPSVTVLKLAAETTQVRVYVRVNSGPDWTEIQPADSQLPGGTPVYIFEPHSVLGPIVRLLNLSQLDPNYGQLNSGSLGWPYCVWVKGQ